MNIPVIVSRHVATVEFLKKHFSFLKDAEVLSGNVTAEDVAGRIVVGNLPMHLAQYAKEYWAVEFTGTPPRGQEYGEKELIEAGLNLCKYEVKYGGMKLLPE